MDVGTMRHGIGAEALPERVVNIDVRNGLSRGCVNQPQPGDLQQSTVRFADAKGSENSKRVRRHL